MDNSEDGIIPSELKEHLGTFDSAISELETMLQPLLSTPRSDVVAKLGPLDSAKLDLVGVYSLNSLFWMYLNVCGVNPKEHAVKGELERIRLYMGRIKEAQDELSKPRQRIDKEAVGRFVKRNLPRNALWENSIKKAAEDCKPKAASVEEMSESQPGGTEDGGPPKNKRRKQRLND